MEASSDYPAVKSGTGWAACGLEDLGDGPGFRKVRRALGVSAFGVNAIVLPPGADTGSHFHEQQEELYFVHRGTIEMPGTAPFAARGRARARRRRHRAWHPQHRGE